MNIIDLKLDDYKETCKDYMKMQPKQKQNMYKYILFTFLFGFHSNILQHTNIYITLICFICNFMIAAAPNSIYNCVISFY